MEETAPAPEGAPAERESRAAVVQAMQGLAVFAREGLNADRDGTLQYLRDQNELRRQMGLRALEDHALVAIAAGRDPSPRLPLPMSMGELLNVPEPDERFIVEGLIPAAANVLVAGYPKSGKTNFLLELGVAAASATPFLARFRVPRPHRIALVLMEDRAHRVRRRLSRICAAHQVDPAALEGLLHFWFRPPLRLSDVAVMQDLRGYVRDLELDLLMIDSWAYTATGNSNDSDEVTPQLQALTDACAEAGCTPLLVHHARKVTQETSSERLTDAIRNSSAFGAWYDTGLILARSNETSPVKVRAELRDLPAPDAFAFEMEDEYPAGPDHGLYPGGYLRLRAMNGSPAVVEQDAAAAKLLDSVAAYLLSHPRCSLRELRKGVGAQAKDVDAAFKRLCDEGRARYEKPAKPGLKGACYLTVSDRVSTVSETHSGGGVSTVSHTTPIRGGGNETRSDGSSAAPGRRHGPGIKSTGFPCEVCRDPMKLFGAAGTVCLTCRQSQAGD